MKTEGLLDGIVDFLGRCVENIGNLSKIKRPAIKLELLDDKM